MAQIFKAKKKPLQQKSVVLDITNMDHQGRGIAKYNNKAVSYTHLTLPTNREV